MKSYVCVITLGFCRTHSHKGHLDNHTMTHVFVVLDFLVDPPIALSLPALYHL